MKTRKRISIVVALCLAMTASVFVFTGCSQPQGTGPADDAAPPAGEPSSAGVSNEGDAAPASESEAIPGAAEGEKFTFKLSYFPNPQSFNGQAYDYFASQVSKYSGGSITIEQYPSGSLVADPDVMDAIQNGTCTFAHGVVSYMDPIVKEMTPLEVPGAFNGENYVEQCQALKPVLDEILIKYGIKFIQCTNQATAAIYNNSKEILKPEDLNGMTVRASGKWIGDTITAWGGTPTSIPIADLATAVERNTVDSVYSGWTVYDDMKFYEVTDYVTFTELQANWAGLIMNMDDYNRLNDAQKQAVDKAGEDFVIFSDEITTKAKQDLLDLLEGMDKNVTVLDASGTEPFLAATDELLAQTAEIAGADGAKLIEALATLR